MPNTSTPSLSRETTQTIPSDNRSPAASSQFLVIGSPRQGATLNKVSDPEPRPLRSPRSTPFDTPIPAQAHLFPNEPLRELLGTAGSSIIDPDLESRIEGRSTTWHDGTTISTHSRSRSPRQPTRANESDSDHRRKRLKHSPTPSRYGKDFVNPFDVPRGEPYLGNRSTGLSIGSLPSPDTQPNMLPSPYSPAPSVGKPLSSNKTSMKRTSSDDTRRLSIKSLLSRSGDMEGDDGNDASLPTLGFDQGRADLDLPKNDDANALTAYSPSSTLRQLDAQRFPSPSYAGSSNGFGFGLQAKDPNFDGHGYYREPVPVQIPRSLEPLPELLTENPMNLLYFHHFLNHTARILVPHDCPDNPFRNILPQCKCKLSRWPTRR